MRDCPAADKKAEARLMGDSPGIGKSPYSNELCFLYDIRRKLSWLNVEKKLRKNRTREKLTARHTAKRASLPAGKLERRKADAKPKQEKA